MLPALLVFLRDSVVAEKYQWNSLSKAFAEA
jgi:hypothetical protein